MLCGNGMTRGQAPVRRHAAFMSKDMASPMAELQQGWGPVSVHRAHFTAGWMLCSGRRRRLSAAHLQRRLPSHRPKDTGPLAPGGTWSLLPYCSLRAQTPHADLSLPFQVRAEAHPRGAVLWRQGEAPASAFLLLGGAVALSDAGKKVRRRRRRRRRGVCGGRADAGMGAGRAKAGQAQGGLGWVGGNLPGSARVDRLWCPHSSGAFQPPFRFGFCLARAPTVVLGPILAHTSPPPLAHTAAALQLQRRSSGAPAQPMGCVPQSRPLLVACAPLHLR